MKFLSAVAIFATVAFCAASTTPSTDESKKKEQGKSEEEVKQELSHKHLEEVKKEVHKPPTHQIHKLATRPLMIQEIIRVQEKIVVDEHNKPKAFAANVVKAIYKVENGTRKRLSFSRFFIRPRAIPVTQNHQQQQQQHHSLPKNFPMHAREDVDFLGLLGVLGFVIGFGALAYLLASYLDRRDQEKKEKADYAKLLKVPTSEQMANHAPTAPSFRA